MNDTTKTKLTGYDLLNNSRLNKGTAFTKEERDVFALHGLLPPHVGTLKEQEDRRHRGLTELPTMLEKYSFLRDLQDTNETLFYSLITHHVDETLPMVYTPTVGEACQNFSEIWRKPRGLFLSYPNKDRIDQIVSHSRYDGIKCIVVSDGERSRARSSRRSRKPWRRIRNVPSSFLSPIQLRAVKRSHRICSIGRKAAL
jgi:malate dehydrogenase (oxaloacetate-decarboxylating)